MSILAGLQAVQQANRGRQTARLRAAQATAAEDALAVEENNRYIQTGSNLGYIDNEYRLNRDAIKADLDSAEVGRQNRAKEFLARGFGRLNDNDPFKPDNLDLLQNGKYAITGKNPDGSLGVVTDEGTNDPNDPVVGFTSDQLVDYVENVYATRVLPRSRVDSIYQRQLNQFNGIGPLTNQAMQVAADTGDKQALREVNAALTNTPKENREAAAAGIVTSLGGTPVADPDALQEETNAVSNIDALRKQIQPLPEGQGRRANRERAKARANNRRVEQEIDAEYEKLPEIVALREELTSKSPRVSGVRRSEILSEIDKIKANPVATPEVKAVAERIPSNPEEAKRAITENAATLNAAEAKAVADQARAANITNIQEITRLPRQQQYALIAAMAAAIPPGTARNNAISQMFNIAQTGSPDVNLGKAADINNAATRNALTAQSQAATRATKADEAFTAIDTKVTEFNEVLVGENGEVGFQFDGAERKARLLLNPVAVQAKRAQAKILKNQAPTPQEAEARRRFLEMITTYAQAKGEQQGGSIFRPLETLAKFLRDDAEFQAGGASAANLRVIEENGKPSRIVFADPNGGRTDDSISIQELRKGLSNTAVDTLIQMAKQNQQSAQ